MFKKIKLYNFPIPFDFDLIEIGGGLGDISCNFLKNKYSLKLFLEPDLQKFEVASKKLPLDLCQNANLSDCNFSKIYPTSKKVFVIMQDVIEHIPKLEQKNFFKDLNDKYEEIFLIGRTPNLKSPFGARNSYGDMTHLHRFTDCSLKNFLNQIGFQKVITHHEPYRITGVTSFMRYLPYLITIGISSLSFVFVFGTWEGIQTPNLIFKSSNFRKK